MYMINLKCLDKFFISNKEKFLMCIFHEIINLLVFFEIFYSTIYIFTM